MSVVLEQQTEFAEAFGRTMKTLRKARRISQEALAKRSGLAYASIRQWENGRPDRETGGVRHILPNIHNLLVLCRALDLPMWKLLQQVEWRVATEKAQRKAVPKLGEVFKVRRSDYAAADSHLQ